MKAYSLPSSLAVVPSDMASAAHNMVLPSEQSSPASPQKDPVANSASNLGISSGQLRVSPQVCDVWKLGHLGVPGDSAVLVLFEHLRKEVDISFKHYEREVHRVLQAQPGDTSGHGSLGRSVAVPNKANIGFTKVAWSDKLAAVPEPVEEATMDHGVSAVKRHKTKHQDILAAALEQQGSSSIPDEQVLQDQQNWFSGRRSYNSITHLQESNKKRSDSILIDSIVKDIAASDPETGWIDKVTQLEFNAKPLVSEKSWLNKRMKDAKYRNLLNFSLLLDALLIVVELQFLSHKMTNNRGIYEEPAFKFVSLVLCLFFWVDIITALTLEFPKVDLVVGRSGFRFLMLVALVQHTLDLVGAFALPNQRFTSVFRTCVARVLFLRIIRTTVVLPRLAGASMRQKLGMLHIMIRTFTGTVQPLLWCVLMYFIIMLIFGVYFTEGAVSYIVQMDTNAGLDEPLTNGWGTLFKSVFSLSTAMLGGKDWADVYDTLDLLAFPSKASFGAFICFTQIAMLNSVTAVFMKCAFLRFERDREFVVQEELDHKREYLLDVKRIFSELDEDQDGSIQSKEMFTLIRKPQFAAYFSKLGVDTDEVDKLFEIMDEDESGSINQEEFLWGCLRLKGEAKSLDLEILQRDLSFAVKRILEIHNVAKTLSRDTSTDGCAMHKVAEQLADMQRNIQDRFARIESRFVD